MSEWEMGLSLPSVRLAPYRNIGGNIFDVAVFRDQTVSGSVSSVTVQARMFSTTFSYVFSAKGNIIHKNKSHVKKHYPDIYQLFTRPLFLVGENGILYCLYKPGPLHKCI
jgi:hypothetical protein